MWVQSFFIFLSVISIIGGIKVPTENIAIHNPEMVPSASTSAETFQVRPIYYTSNGETSDSYLIPPDPHKPVEVHHDVPTPATYLLPPSPDAQNEYFFKPTEPGEQTDWYPISEIPQKQNIVNGQLDEDKENIRTGKKLHRGQVLSMPTRTLLPPRENAPNDFIVVSPSVELELPLEQIDHTIVNPSPDVHILRKPPPRHLINQENIPVHYISPSKYFAHKYKNPTGLYPKKYVGEFKPIPIPISQYDSGSKDEIPVARPVKVINPVDIKQEYTSPPTQNNDHSFSKTRKLKKYNEAPELAPETDDTYREVTPTEQDTSETNFRHPTRDTYPAPVRQIPQTQNPYKSDGKRTEFRMHGMKGPHSYQFGYDTGKGKNRQFRYEERDNDGHVRGHYGYMDRGGKLRVVNYDADPVHGFRAEAPVEKDVE